MATRWALVVLFCLIPNLAWSKSIPIMPSSEVQRGMRGYGLTVFRGTRIDTFQVEIVGVMRNALGAKTDIIWGMMSGGPLAETGIISGMSGSPVYVDGKLIGAVAYGYRFCKEPLAGITPIEKMLEVFDNGLEPKKDVYRGEPSGTPSWYSALSLGSATVGQIPELEYSEGAGLEPLGTPLAVSGFHPAVVAEATGRLAGLGLSVVQGGGGGTTEMGLSVLQPGAALAVPLVQGDYSAAGLGTVTYRDGDRLLAFGHPMFFDGDTELPMGGAYIDEVVPSVLSSFKIGSADRPVGVIRQDRQAAIAGLVGQLPEMVPVVTRIARAGSDRTVYNFEVVRHRRLTTQLVSWALMSAIRAEEAPSAEQTVVVQSTIEVEGHPPIRRENTFSGDFALYESWQSILWPLETVLDSDFERVRIARVVFDLVTESQSRSAVLEGLRVNRTTLKPGEDAIGVVCLRRAFGDRFDLRFSIRVPEDTPEGPLILRASDAASSQRWDQMRAPGKYEARTIRDLIRILSYEEHNDHLIVELFLPEAGLTVEGQELPALPGSVMAVLKDPRQTGQIGSVQGSTVARLEIAAQAVLSGAQTMALRVSRTGR